MENVMCKEMNLTERMKERCKGDKELTEHEIDVVCSELALMTQIFKRAFGLNIVVCEKMPKGTVSLIKGEGRIL